MSTVTARPYTPPSMGRFPVNTGSSCLRCGASASGSPGRQRDESQRRITELESQVKILSDKATAAADKLADYEDELRHLRATNSNLSAPATEDRPHTATGTISTSPTIDRSGTTPPPAAQTPPPVQTMTSRFGSLLGRQKSAANLRAAAQSPSPDVSSPSKRESDLAKALAKEQTLRQKAEGQVSQLNGEVEELSASLFQQANEMVANERKERAKLEDRIMVLEKRDTEKRQRLERLEGALKRIDRVKGLLSVP